MAPEFAAGHIYSAGICDLVFASLHTNPRADQLFTILLTGQVKTWWSWWESTLARQKEQKHLDKNPRAPGLTGVSGETSGEDTEYAELCEARQQGRIRQIGLPLHLVGSQWHVIFAHMLSDLHCIAIALFRQPRGGNSMPFVVTNPESHTVVFAKDRLFVIDSMKHPLVGIGESQVSSLPRNAKQSHIIAPRDRDPTHNGLDQVGAVCMCTRSLPFLFTPLRCAGCRARADA